MENSHPHIPSKERKKALALLGKGAQEKSKRFPKASLPTCSRARKIWWFDYFHTELPGYGFAFCFLTTR